MGKSKRKNVSPLQKDTGKNRRTEEDEAVPEAEEDSRSQYGWNDDTLTDLKDFIRSENVRSNKKLAEDMRAYSDERLSALETSLSFALTTNETLARRLTEAEARASQAESDFRMCLKRLSEIEQDLDQLHQRDLKDWLVFSGPAIPRLSRSDRSRDAGRLLCSMLQQLMNFSLDMQQVAELYREERQICVRFSTGAAGSDRYLLVRNRTRLRGSGLYIREKLTPARQQIFSKLMQLKREDRISTVFTRDGTVFAVMGQRDRPRPVRSEVALQRLTRELIERSAGHLTAEPSSTQPPRGGADPAVAQRGRSLMPWDSPASNSGAVASGRAAFPGSLPGCVADADGRSAEQERSGSASRPADCRDGGAEAVRGRRSVTPASGVAAAMDCDGPVSGPGGTDRPQSTPRSGPAGGGGTGGTSAGAGGAGGGDDVDGGVPGGGDGGGGGGSRAGAAVPEPAPPSTTEARPMRGAAGVRHRFGGDIRQFVKAHSKCD